MVNTRFWIDDYISNLDPIEKLLFLYFLTNPSTDICGVYELPLKNIALDTGLDKEMVVKIVNRFSTDGKIFYKNGWVGIKNFAKHQAMNPKVKMGIEIGLAKAPKEILDSLSYPIDSLSHLNSNINSNSNLKSEVSDTPIKIIKFTEKDVEMVSLLTGLIKQNNPAWQMRGNPDKWSEDINKIHRIDNRTYEQIAFMIRWTQKDPFWSQNILSASKLRDKFNDLIPKVKGRVSSGGGRGLA